MNDDVKDFSVGNNNNPLRLLIMDGIEKGAETTAALIRKLGFTVEVKHVRDTEELKEQVGKDHWDLMIAPPRLADTNASQIINILTRHEQDIPLLILASDISDPLVLDALQSGARAFISNEIPEFFDHTLKCELDNLAQRRARVHFENLSIEYREKCDFLMEQTSGNSAELEAGAVVSVAQGDGQAPTSTGPAAVLPPSTPAETPNESQSHKDLLTGLMNYQYFRGELEQLAAKLKDQDTRHALLYLELDNFVAIKEQAGIAAADLVLNEMANVIKDSLGNDHIGARYGDNTFVILRKETDPQGAQKYADSLCNRVAAHVYAVIGQTVPKPTCSIGISILSGESPTPQETISHAQIAGRVARSEGGNKAHMYDEKMDAQASRESDKESERIIQASLKENRFRLVYQPIVNLHSRPAENYEILLRMLDEENKEILPGEFMPAAEHCGLMPQVDRWVIENALIELAKRHVAGKQTTFFIKLSASTLKDKLFPAWFGKKINTIKLPAGSVVFEINESIAIRHTVQVKKYINWLKTMRCSCAIDHFGTHPSSMDIIKELSADFLKIDRSFIHNLANTKGNIEKIKSIVGEAQSLNKQTIAQFVQDANSLSILWQCGVDYIQGYFLQRPEASLMYEFTEF